MGLIFRYKLHKATKEGVIIMKMTLNSDEKRDAKELFNFISRLSENEKNDFAVFIKGFELGKQVGTKQVLNHKMN